MNPFSWNDALIAIIIVAALVFIPGMRWRRPLLTLMALFGIVFAGSIHWAVGLAYVGIFIGIVLAAWLFGKALYGKDQKETWLTFALSMFVIFIPLFLFKSALALITWKLAPALPLLKQSGGGINMASLLPVGISYFSFRSAAYLIEVRRGTINVLGFWRLFHYAFFWPTLLAGPIERPGAFLRQDEQPKKPDNADVMIGFARVITGFVKKTVVASVFANLARPYLDLGADFSGFYSFSTVHLWLCVTSYYLYLYLDFSAYSDLAIGVSRMMGYRIMENFRWPVLATNVSQFWQRWHISLTSWVTDYIYRPLGGNRKGLANAARYSLVAMIVVGAWHGMSLHFIAWGIYHALFLILYRQWRKVIRPKFFKKEFAAPHWLKTGLSWFVTFQIVNLGWVLFIFPVGKSLRVWARLFGLG